jgi:hypothetical protein
MSQRPWQTFWPGSASRAREPRGPAVVGRVGQPCAAGGAERLLDRRLDAAERRASYLRRPRSTGSRCLTRTLLSWRESVRPVWPTRRPVRSPSALRASSSCDAWSKHCAIVGPLNMARRGHPRPYRCAAPSGTPLGLRRSIISLGSPPSAGVKWSGRREMAYLSLGLVAGVIVALVVLSAAWSAVARSPGSRGSRVAGPARFLDGVPSAGTWPDSRSRQAGCPILGMVGCCLGGVVRRHQLQCPGSGDRVPGHPSSPAFCRHVTWI